jgi:predicted nucleic acid-binding protein
MTKERFFLDTVFIQALVDRNDDLHSKVVKLLPRMRQAKRVWVTEAVFIEVANALSKMYRAKAAEFIEECYNTPNISVVPLDAQLFNSGLQMYKSYKDKDWSLVYSIENV